MLYVSMGSSLDHFWYQHSENLICYSQYYTGSTTGETDDVLCSRLGRQLRCMLSCFVQSRPVSSSEGATSWMACYPKTRSSQQEHKHLNFFVWLYYYSSSPALWRRRPLLPVAFLSHAHMFVDKCQHNRIDFTWFLFCLSCFHMFADPVIVTHALLISDKYLFFHLPVFYLSKMDTGTAVVVQAV